MNIRDTLNRVARSRFNRVLGGVCAGFAEATGTPPWLWRAGAVLAGLHLGGGVVVYLILWAVMPVDGDFR